MIIHIDSSDELNTIVHRIRDEQASEILLVIPQENRILRNEINFQLLVKYGKEAKKELSIKTSDSVIAANAYKYNLMVLMDESAATKDAENDVGNKKRSQRQQRKLRQDRLIVILLVIAAVLGLTYYNLPKALIIVTPATNEFTEELVYELAQIDGLDLLEAKVTLTRQTPATGRKTEGISAARGVVTLVNQSQNNVLVDQGTIVATSSGVQFKTVNEVVIPAVKTEYFMDIPTGLTAGRGEVDIEAVDLGTRGNVSAGRIVNIAGYDLDVRNFDPITGGEDVVIQVASDSDLKRAQNSVERDGRDLIIAQLQDQVGDRFLVSDTLSYSVEWNNSSEVDEETNEVIATGVYKGEVYAVDSHRLANQVSESLMSFIPSNFTIEPDTFVFNNLSVTNNEPKQINVTVSVQISGIIDTEGLAYALAGQSRDYLDNVINDNPEIGTIQIEQGASDKLPRLPRWLKIEIGQPVY